jgi:purine-binding chemotaxis protein CheW
MSSQLVTFTLAGAHYGIDLLRVQEALRGKARTAVPLAGPEVAGFINLRGQVVLTIDLRTRLGIETVPADVEPMMIVVDVGGEPISLLVDDVGDVIDVSGRRLEAPPDTLPSLMCELSLGVYQVEDSPLLVLDIDRVTGIEVAAVPAPDHGQGRIP